MKKTLLVCYALAFSFPLALAQRPAAAVDSLSTLRLQLFVPELFLEDTIISSPPTGVRSVPPRSSSRNLSAATVTLEADTLEDQTVVRYYRADHSEAVGVILQRIPNERYPIVLINESRQQALLQLTNLYLEKIGLLQHDNELLTHRVDTLSRVVEEYQQLDLLRLRELKLMQDGYHQMREANQDLNQLLKDSNKAAIRLNRRRGWNRILGYAVGALTGLGVGIVIGNAIGGN